MFLRLTDLKNNLVLVNIEKVACFHLRNEKGMLCCGVAFGNGNYIPVKESVPEISLLLQAAGKVVI